MNRIMAVYDVDPFYADRFADFANQKERIPFMVMAFTSLEKLKAYAKDHEIEILLISSSVDSEMYSQVKAALTVILADGEVVQVKESYPSIYKYQSTDCILREVMACYGEKPVEAQLRLVGSKSTVIGIYSPVGRCLKTSFALAMGQLISKDSRVLYLNLEEYSGFSRLTGESYKGDLSDVLYVFRQGSYHWMKLSSYVYTWGNLDYIPSVRYPEDLCQISSEEMAELIGRMAQESSYETIIVDLGQFGKNVVEILEACDVVYMPVKEDCISVAKLEEFLEYLEISKREYIKDKIQKLKLPYHNSFGRRDTYMEQLLWGELGDYVRQLLKGQIKPWGH